MIIRRPVNKPRWFGLTGLSRPPLDSDIILTGIPEFDNLKFPPRIGGTTPENRIPTNEPGIYYRNDNFILERYNPTLGDWEELPDIVLSGSGDSSGYRGGINSYGSEIWGSSNPDMRASMAIMTNEYGSSWYNSTTGKVEFSPNGWLGGRIFPVQGTTGYTKSASKVSTSGDIIPLKRGQWVVDVKMLFCYLGSLRKKRPTDVPIPPVTVVPEFTQISSLKQTDNADNKLGYADVSTVGWLENPSDWRTGTVFDVHRLTSVQDLMWDYNYPDYYGDDLYSKHFTSVSVSSANLGRPWIAFSGNFTSQLIYDEEDNWTGWERLLYEGRPARLEDIKDNMLRGSYAASTVYPNRSPLNAISAFKLHGGI